MTSVTATGRTRRSMFEVAELVGEVTGTYVAGLQNGYLADHSKAVATLAQLRRGAGKLPHDAPELWGVAGLEQLYDGEQGLNDHDLEHVRDRAESALFVAVTLYALHQQSRKRERMYRSGVGLGAAIRRLMPKGEIDEPIRRRFIRVGTATSLETLAYRLREIVSLLRGAAVPLDYGLLAAQLYQLQWPDGLRRVRQDWGRGFHSYRPPAAPDSLPTVDDDDTEKDM